MYLGADHDVWAAGEDLGVAQECRVEFSKDHLAEAFTDVSSMNARYRRGMEGWQKRKRSAPCPANPEKQQPE